MSNSRTGGVSRRDFLEKTGAGLLGSAVLGEFPTVVPSSVFGANAPSNRINIGAIGNGRISRAHDLPGVWKYDNTQIIAVSDLDSKRLEDAKRLLALREELRAEEERLALGRMDLARRYLDAERVAVPREEFESWFSEGAG